MTSIAMGMILRLAVHWHRYISYSLVCAGHDVRSSATQTLKKLFCDILLKLFALFKCRVHA